MKRIGARIVIIAALIFLTCAVRAGYSEQESENPQIKNSVYTEENRAVSAEENRPQWGDNAGDNIEEPAGYEDSSNDDSKE